MTTFRKGARVLLFAAMFAGTIALFLFLLGYFFKQAATYQTQARLNAWLGVSTQIEDSRIDFITYFPRPAIVLNRLQVPTSGKNKAPWLKVDKVIGLLRWQDILWGNAQITQLILEQGSVTVGDTKGDEAGNLWQKALSGLEQASLLDKITFQQIQVAHPTAGYQLTLQQSNLRFERNGSAFIIEVSLQAEPFKWLFEGNPLLQYSALGLTGFFEIQTSKGDITLKDTKIKFKESELVVKGAYNYQKQNIDITFTGTSPDLKPLIAFLPEQYYDKWMDYKTEGQVQFNGSVRGTWAAAQAPHIALAFNADNINIRSPNIRQTIREASFQARFTNGESNSLKTTSLWIQNLKGKLAGQKFKAQVSLEDFTNPKIIAELQAAVDLAALEEFYPFGNIEKMQGFLGVELSLNGTYQDLAKATTAGRLDLRDVGFKIKNVPFVLSALQISLDLNNREAKIEQFSGKAGNSDFLVRGTIVDLVAALINPKESAKLQGTLLAKKLDLAELFSYTSFSAGLRFGAVNQHHYYFRLPMQWSGSMRIKADSLSFKTFQGARFMADLQLHNQVLEINQMTLQTNGGNLQGIAQLNAQQPDFMRLDGHFLLNGAQAGGVLASFDGFGQSFLPAAVVRGTLKSDLLLGLVFDQYLEISPTHTFADIKLNLQQGALSGWQALNRLATAVKSKKINLPDPFPFAEINAQLQIRNKSIFIPDMEINAKPAFSITGRSTWAEGSDYTIKFAAESAAALPVVRKGKTTYYTLRSGHLFWVKISGFLQDFSTQIQDFKDIATLENQWQAEQRNLRYLLDKIPLRLAPAIQNDTLKYVF